MVSYKYLFIILLTVLQMQHTNKVLCIYSKCVQTLYYTACIYKWIILIEKQYMVIGTNTHGLTYENLKHTSMKIFLEIQITSLLVHCKSIREHLSRQFQISKAHKVVLTYIFESGFIIIESPKNHSATKRLTFSCFWIIKIKT